MDAMTGIVGDSEIKHPLALKRPFMFVTLPIHVGIQSKPAHAAFSNSHV